MSIGHISLLLMLSAAICFALSLYAWRRRHSDPTAVSLFFLLLAAAVWSLFYGGEFAVTGFTGMRIMSVLQYLGLAPISVLWLVFAARYSGADGWLTGRTLVLLFIVPAVTVAMVATNSLHHLYYSHVQTGASHGHTFLLLQPGPFWWLHVVYSYAALLLGAALMVRMFAEVTGTSRLRIAYFLGGMLLAAAVNAAYVAGFRPFGFLDLTPVAFTVTGAMLTVGIFTADIFGIKPVALDVLFDRIRDAVFVVSPDGAVVNANPVAQLLLESATEAGQTLHASGTTQSGDSTSELESEGWDVVIGDRTFHRTSTGLLTKGGTILGTLVVMSDITGRKAAEDALQRSRDQYQALVDNIPGATYRRTADAELTMEYMSPGIEAVTGYHAGDFVNGPAHTYESLIHPDDVERLASAIAMAVERGEAWELEYRILHLNGDTRWVYEKGVVTAAPGGSAYLNGFILDITQSKRDRMEIERSHRELRRLASHLQVVRDRERAAIAWELHDEVGQSLAAVKMNLSRGSGPSDAETVTIKRERLDGAVQILDSSIARLRRLYSDLRPGMLDDLGLAATVEWQCSEFSRRTGIECLVERLDDVELPEERCTLTMYRVFQEVLANDIRPSGATSARIRVENREHHLVVHVADNRPGMAAGSASVRDSLSHAAMRERLRDCQGTLLVRRNDEGDTITEFGVPLDHRH